MLPSASSFGVSADSHWEQHNRNGNGLNGNAFGYGQSQQNGMFSSPTPAFKQSTSSKHTEIEESFSLSNVYDDFAQLLENLHFNAYKDVFDVVKEFGRVSSSR